MDGLTKNWRYPGWRVTWTVGPKRVIESITNENQKGQVHDERE